MMAPSPPPSPPHRGGEGRRWTRELFLQQALNVPLPSCGGGRRYGEYRSMLTPAEEMGLSGLSLATRVRKAFEQIPEPELICLMERIREEAVRRHLIYLRDG